MSLVGQRGLRTWTCSTETVQSVSIMALTAAVQGRDEEQVLTGLALEGVLAGQLAGASLRWRLVVATERLAVEISVLGRAKPDC